MYRPLACALSACTFFACGGSGPLLHPAHVLHPGDVSLAAGLSAQALLLDTPPESPANTLQAVSAPPGVAPWLGVRVGIPGSNEAGLSATSRTARLDGRHAFRLGSASLSLGIGANAVFAGRVGEEEKDARAITVYGGGVDVPVLIGGHTDNDLYAAWVGPRVGFDWVGGRIDGSPAAGAGDFNARRIHAGLVLGFRAGFRHVHTALELSGTFHRIDGAIGQVRVGTHQWSVAPGGALILTF